MSNPSVEFNVIFDDDLTAISFTLDGEIVDPRFILNQLAAGRLKIIRQERVWIDSKW